MCAGVAGPPKQGRRVWPLVKPRMLVNAPRPHPSTAKHTPRAVGPILTPWLKPVGVAAAEPGAAAAAAKANAAAGTAASNTPWWPQALREGKRKGTAY